MDNVHYVKGWKASGKFGEIRIALLKGVTVCIKSCANAAQESDVVSRLNRSFPALFPRSHGLQNNESYMIDALGLYRPRSSLVSVAGGITVRLPEICTLEDLLTEKANQRAQWVSFDDRNMITVMHGVLNGGIGMHSMNLLHNDIKPDNICLYQMDGCIHPKIIDYGSVSRITDLRRCPKEKSETPSKHRHIAPEIFQQKPYSPTTDTHSVGFGAFSIAFFTITCVHPYR